MLAVTNRKSQYILKVVNHQVVNHQAVNHQAVNHRAVNHRVVNHRAVNHRVVNHRAVNHRVVNHQAVNHRVVNHQAVNHQAVNHRAVNHRVVNHRVVNHRPSTASSLLLDYRYSIRFKKNGDRRRSKYARILLYEHVKITFAFKRDIYAASAPSHLKINPAHVPIVALDSL
jgi:hypothetical protein